MLIVGYFMAIMVQDESGQSISLCVPVWYKLVELLRNLFLFISLTFCYLSLNQVL